MPHNYTKSWKLLKKGSSVFRSSHQKCSVKKGVLRNFAKFTGKHLCQSLFFNEVAGDTFFYRTPVVAASRPDIYPIYALFYKQHFYKHRQAEIVKKTYQRLSNILRLNFCYFRIIRFLHTRYHPEKVKDILRNVQ